MIFRGSGASDSQLRERLGQCALPYKSIAFTPRWGQNSRCQTPWREFASQGQREKVKANSLGANWKGKLKS